MSREEAIQILKPFREAMIDQHGCPISDAVFAIDVAIKSLEAWDKVADDINKIECSATTTWYDFYQTVLKIIDKHMKEVEE